MSWQAYVDSNLVGSKGASKAAIFGHDGSKWATSAGFNPTADEVKKIVAAFKDAAGIRASGVIVGGVKYFAVKADERTIYAKKGAEGVCAVKTSKAVLISVHDDKITTPQCSKITEALADYLIEQGF